MCLVAAGGVVDAGRQGAGLADDDKTLAFGAPRDDDPGAAPVAEELSIA